MRRKSIASFILVVIILVSVIFWGLNRRQVRLERSIAQTVQQYNVGYTPQIELAAITDFEWDTLYIFPPYTPREKIEEQLGSLFGARATSISTNDSVTLLVFVSGEKVVRWVEFPRAAGDFSFVADQQPFTPETALFFIFPEGTNELRVLRVP